MLYSSKKSLPKLSIEEEFQLLANYIQYKSENHLESRMKK